MPARSALSPCRSPRTSSPNWVFAFFRLVEENASSQDGLQVDVEQNARIGAVVKALAA